MVVNFIERSPQGCVINVFSVIHKMEKIEFSDSPLEKSFSAWGGYAQSKLAENMIGFRWYANPMAWGILKISS